MAVVAPSLNPASTNIEPILVDVHQAAQLLGVSVWQVREWTQTGMLPTAKLPSTSRNAINRRTLISVEALRAFAASGKA